MTTQELIEALRNKQSRDNRELLDEAADMIERTTKLDETLATDVREFIEECFNSNERPLCDHIASAIMQDIIDGKCRITQSATNNKTMEMFVRFTWNKE